MLRASTQLLCCISSDISDTDSTRENNMAHPLKSYGIGSSCPKLAKGMLRLYSMRFSPYAQRTRLVLEHKKIPYETVNVQLYYGKKPKWLLKKNPFGQVPVLERDNQIIYESTAICEWLDDMYPDNPLKLMPDDPYKKAEDRALLENLTNLAERFRRVLFKPEPEPESSGGPFEITTTFRYLIFQPGPRDTAIPMLRDNLKYYENALKERGGIFFGGQEPSMLDFYLWPDMERNVFMLKRIFSVDLKELVNKKDCPKTKDWYEAMRTLPAVKATMLDEDNYYTFLRTLTEGEPNYDSGL